MPGTGYDTTTTYGTSATATDTEASGADDLLGDLDNEEEDEDLITGVTQQNKRIVLTKQTPILVAFCFVTCLSIFAVVYILAIHLEQYDYPPTLNSNESLRDTIYSLIVLTIVTPIGFIILNFRITNLLIGLLYLFLFVLCLIFPAKGFAEAIYSLTQDRENNIHQYSKNPNFDHTLHNFWAAFQVQHSCCGTKEIDRVEDWSYFLNSTDLPASCCTEKQHNYAKSLKLGANHDIAGHVYTHRDSSKRHKPELDATSSYCGRGLARTRTRAVTTNRTLLFKRVFSGFFISLTKSERIKMSEKLQMPKFLDNPDSTLVEILDVVQGAIVDIDAVNTFKKIWKNFYIDSVCNTEDDIRQYDGTQPNQGISGKYCAIKAYDFDNDIAYPADMDHTTPIETVGVIKDLTKAKDACKEGWKSYALDAKSKAKNLTLLPDADQYCDAQLTKSRQNATTIGRELLLQLDYLTSYIYEVGKPKKNALPVKKKTWMLWPIPTRYDRQEVYPYKLNANYKRDPETGSTKDPKHTKKMYYFSRGISENLVLENIIFEKTCELTNDDYIPNIRKKLARDLNKRWRRATHFSEWKNQDEGLGFFFLSEVHRIMYITIGICATCIGCVVFLALIFWQYYSRIKAEEYANLALPKDFEVLHLRRGSLIDEADIAKEIVKPKKQKPKFFRGRARVGPTQGALGRGFQRRPMRWGTNVHQSVQQQPPHPFHHHPSQIPPGMGRGQAPAPGGPPAGPGAPHHRSN